MSRSLGRRGTIDIFIADGDRMSCQLIAAAFRQSRYRLWAIGYAADAAGVNEGLGRNHADVAVIGARLKEGNLSGFDVAQQIRASHLKLSVVMILDSVEPAIVVEAFRVGANGIFSRDEPFELLCKCIRVVHQGEVWASNKELKFVIDALRSPLLEPVQAITPRGARSLTTREEGVVRLVAEGLTNRDISRQLDLSQHTVRNYLFRIFDKVGTSNRLELALYAIDRKDGDKSAEFTRLLA